jgi:hypothetical protein
LDHVRKSALLARGLALAGLVMLGVIGAYVSFVYADQSNDRSLLMLVSGLALIGLVLIGGALILMIWHLLILVLKIEANSFRTYDAIHGMQDRIAQHETHLSTIAENIQLSDLTRALTHRSKERTALRLAINDELIRGDLEAAYALVEQLEARHGYRNEAARLREEVDAARSIESEEKVHESVDAVRRLIDAQDWDRARREMDRLLAASPGNTAIRELPGLFTRRRGDHKRKLLKDWDESVRRNEVDQGIAILKELDQYLTPNEAEALAESARGVFRAKLHNLGVQFSLAVTEHSWKSALAVGRQIVEEFPNSRMAAEVNERLHVLQKRAADEDQPVSVISMD